MKNYKNIFSIIIPTYNSDKYLKLCLQSIKNSSLSNYTHEIIIVDGGSTDDTTKIAMQYSKIKLISSNNKSISNNRNIGILHSTGEIIAFIDSDCAVEYSLFKNAVSFLRNYSCYGSFYSAASWHGWVAKSWLLVERKKKGITKWLPGGTMCIRRETLNNTGLFNELLQTEEDMDLCKRIRMTGGEIYNDPSVASVHLGQANSLVSFWKKETWRGKSLIKPFNYYMKNGLSKFDLVVFFYFTNYSGIIIALNNVKILIPIAFNLSLLPFLFTLKTVLRHRSLKFSLNILFLYYIFFAARSWSIIKFNQIRNLKFL
jgi:glycosyltransferase involved in cell wall biosynthesis